MSSASERATTSASRPKAPNARCSNSAFGDSTQGRQRQTVRIELRVVELGELAVAGPDERLPGRVDLVRERHALVVVDPRDRLRERKGDAFEGVVVVVEDDHAPRV